MSKQNQKKKQNDLLNLLLLIIILILANIIGGFVFFRIDLTEDNRYTLSETTIDFLDKLDDVIYLKIYLEGEDLPPGFRKLRNSLKEMLDEFRIYAGDNIQYDFIDPFESPDLKTKGEIGRQLMKKGLSPTTIEMNDDKGSSTDRLIFSGAILTYRNNEIPLEFLKNNMMASGEENINYSIQLLEFGLMQSMSQLMNTEKKKIALLGGHGELQDIEIADFRLSLEDVYEVQRVNLNERLDALIGFDALIVAKPDSSFTEKDKYIIDQYIMRGGKCLWLVDGAKIDMDSLGYSGDAIAMINDLNLDDMFFRYGARINANLLQDINCGGLKINVATAGSPQPKFRLFPWIYFPVLIPNNESIITKNIDLVKTQFVSNIDTLGKDSQIKKQFLLFTSAKSRLVNAPARVSLSTIKDPLDPKYFTKGSLPAAVLLEGRFQSLYKNRLAPDLLHNPDFHFKEKSSPTKMIIVGDGDIARNAIRKSGDKYMPYPLGYDRHTDMTFNGNKDFLLNAVNYLLDDKGIMGVRAKDMKLRLLDKDRIRNEKLKWQLINTITPLIFLVLFGIALNYYRKKKYT